MRKIGLLLSIIALMVTITACGNATTSAKPKNTELKKDVAKLATPKTYTAADVIAKLKQAGLQIDKVEQYNESTDQNHLLGRPGQYTAKTDFTVKGLESNYASIGDVKAGGSVEVFANEADAKNRFQYVTAITKADSMFAEYDYLNGKLFLRLSNYILPSKAAQYDKVFESLK